MCSGNDSGNIVMQKTSWCDSLYRQNIFTLEIHCHLMLLYWNRILKGRGWREFKSGLASIMKRLHLSAQQIKNMWTQRKWWNWFWKTIKTQFKIYPLHWNDLWKLYPTLSMYSWDTAVCVHGGYQDTWHNFTKNWCLEVLFHFFSHLKEEQMGSLNQWWWYETWFRHFTESEL